MDELVSTLKNANIGVVAMKVMAGGQRQTRSGGANDRTREILQRQGASLAALKWVLRNRNVATTIPSITDGDQLEENLKAMAAPFAPEDEKILTARLNEIRPYYCNMCGECEGTCSKGLPVADVLRYVMYAESYGEFGLGRENFQLLSPAQSAVRCGDCNAVHGRVPARCSCRRAAFRAGRSISLEAVVVAGRSIGSRSRAGRGSFVFAVPGLEAGRRGALL